MSSYSNQEMLSFDDVVLVPQYSTFRSRQDADTSCQLFDLSLKAPIITSNMESVTGWEMCVKVWQLGGIGCMHRFMSIEDNVTEYQRVVFHGAQCIVSIGVSENCKDRARALFNAGAKYFCVDIAHGHSILMEEMLHWLREEFSDKIFIMAGNVATGDAVYDLHQSGADVVKVGVGSGSVCSTRVVTGHGSPSFSGMQEVSSTARAFNIPVVQDGGIRSSGDIVKSFVAGANYVMIGSIAAGTTEAPGKITNVDGIRKKKFFGSSSYERKNTAKEGIETLIDYKGSFEPIFENLVAGIRSGMSYCNARHLEDILVCARWRRQSMASAIEGRPHILKG